MLERLRNHLQATPFLPFSVITSGGREYQVLTVDHASLSPDGRLLKLWLDDGGGITLSLLPIAAIHATAATESSAS